MSKALRSDLRKFAWTGAAVLDACPVQAGHGQLLVLTADGVLHGFDFDTGVGARLCAVELPPLPASDGAEHFGVPAFRLHASADGSHAAIVVDNGREGLVVHVPTGKVTMRLDGGDYHEDTVRFSACFVHHDGRDVLVHRTAWNRLDAADPATGASLTERRPEHHLDYFHGRLQASPDGAHIFDDGWVWHPISMPRVFSLAAWLGGNRFEAEDGASVVYLTQRDNWNTPACWIDAGHVALWNVADWDYDEFSETGTGPGVRVFDATEADRSKPWAMDLPAGKVLDLFSDGTRLYVAVESGTTAWDVASRAQVARFPGFVARRHDPVRNTLVGFGPAEIVELALPTPGS